MKKLLIILALVTSACVPIIPPVPIPPRPPATEWKVGVTFAPFDEEEWAHFSWNQLWRIEHDQMEPVCSRGQHPLLVAVAESDSSIDALMPCLQSAWGIELGNEPNFGQDALSVNGWYLRTITRLRNLGYTGRILTAGVGNLDPNTLAWLKISIQNLPPDIIIGWHGYSDWQSQIGSLLAVIGKHPHAMTETGQPTTNANEHQVAVQAISDIRTICQSGSLTFVWYQTHDGQPGTSQSNFGIHAWDKHYREVEHSLIGGMGACN